MDFSSDAKGKKGVNQPFWVILISLSPNLDNVKHLFPYQISYAEDEGAFFVIEHNNL